MQAVQLLVPSSAAQGAPASTASSASTVSAVSEQQALTQQALTQQFAGLMAAQAQVQAAQAQVQAQAQAVQQAQQQHAAATAAMSAGLGGMLPMRYDSQLSLASLKSASVASSLVSSVSPPALLQPSGGSASASASTLASGATGGTSAGKKVRLLLLMHACMRAPAAACMRSHIVEATPHRVLSSLACHCM